MKFIAVIFTAMTFLMPPLAVAEENPVPPLAAVEENLILNPGFEDVGLTQNQDDARFWNEWDSKRSNLYSYNGQWALNCWGSDDSNDRGAWQGDDDGSGESQFISVSPGTRVLFSAYLMSPDTAGIGQSPLAGGVIAFLEIEWRGTKPLESVKSPCLNSTTGGSWEMYSVSGIAPQGTTSVRFVPKAISVPGSSGDVYFDELKAVIVTDED
ncbi:MAG: hypothetical protein KAJ66_04870 [Candidatus Omnitrophica bacterium]|nr:hypothetical protein [Candidatus Omnitrophota bacterium]